MTSISECFEDPTLPGCNSCTVNSTYPGCNDPYCRERVCDGLDQSECCTQAWTDECATAAVGVCIPGVEPIPPNIDGCPLGFVCDEEEIYMSNCSTIRDMPYQLRLGDVYGGVYCKEGRQQMVNCPIGHYCPTPFEQIPCPKGFFCPDKTIKPWIVCDRCEEGAEALERDVFGYIVFSIGVAVLLLAVAVSCVRKHQKDAWDRQVELLGRQVDSIRIQKRRKEKQNQIDRLKPKLDIIAKRLNKIEKKSSGAAAEEDGVDGTSERGRKSKGGGDDGGDGEPTKPTSSKASSLVSKAAMAMMSDGNNQDMIQLDGDKQEMRFDARRIYHALDTNKDGDLSFDELNAVLGLAELELRNFVSRMQELGGMGEECTHVSRPVFEKYFLQVLEENSHLNVTQEEAAATYEVILAENGSEKLREKMLYSSTTLSRILSDQQIYALIKKFRSVASTEGVSSRNSMNSTRRSRVSMGGGETTVHGGGGSAGKTITKDVFVEHYPMFLLQVITMDGDDVLAESMRHLDSPGVDICFKSLSLSVKGLDREINVVDDVTGRIQAKTMTALMGGSGAGKTSLLNALCGRAYYGEVSGDIHINGHKTSIEEIKDSVGFVPQDDIVYAELTVRENFIYAGKFRLPKGTSSEMINDLVEETLASLGLARVADSLVGDVKRRGVSGGEKKRVNIGLELMAKPSCLFLDEPTSGLDASSALLVMSSLKHLVRAQGVTVVSVIHQPRKFIFDLFDSLILLGVGGRMVYHGPTDKAHAYFSNLGYALPPGESVADWLIDISSGRLEAESEPQQKQKQNPRRRSDGLAPMTNVERPLEEDGGIELTSSQFEDEIQRTDTKPLLATQDDDIVGRKGVSTGKEKDAFEEAKVRRAWLYDKWNSYFESLAGEDNEIYEVPEQSKLPETPTKQSFLSQLYAQTTRAFLVSWRSFSSKLIDTLILVGATIVITVSDGLPEMTRSRNPDISFEDLVNPTKGSLEHILSELFLYAAVPQWQFPLKIGIIVAVLIGLQATRIVTSKRLEFFREASSGYNINAYFVAVHFVSTIEHSTQIVILSFFAAWLRDPIANWWSFFAHFLALIWLCVSWALFFPMVVPADNVTVTVGFFMAFCGLMISGAFPPITWKVIYEEGGFKEHLAAWFSPTRWFFESLTVGEYRCMPEQSGFTVADTSVNFDRENTVMRRLGFAGHDPNATQFSCDGWYWGILPAFMVGLTVRYAGWLAMHTFNRPQQTKKSLIFEMKRDKKMIGIVIGLILVLLVLGVVTTWLYTRDLEPNYEYNDIDELLEQAPEGSTSIVEALLG